MTDICVLQSSLFRKSYKKLHANQQLDVDEAQLKLLKIHRLASQKWVIWQEFLFLNSNVVVTQLCWLINLTRKPVICYCWVHTKIFTEI